VAVSVTNSAPYQPEPAVQLTTGLGEEILIALPAEDDEGNLDSTSVTILTPPPSPASVTVDPLTGTFRFTPDTVQPGVYGFQYQVCDSLGWCTAPWVEVTVEAHQPVGTLPTSVTVSRVGASVIEIPIEVPP